MSHLKIGGHSGFPRSPDFVTNGHFPQFILTMMHHTAVA